MISFLTEEMKSANILNFINFYLYWTEEIIETGDQLKDSANNKSMEIFIFAFSFQ